MAARNMDQPADLEQHYLTRLLDLTAQAGTLLFSSFVLCLPRHGAHRAQLWHACSLVPAFECRQAAHLLIAWAKASCHAQLHRGSSLLYPAVLSPCHLILGKAPCLQSA